MGERDAGAASGISSSKTTCSADSSTSTKRAAKSKSVLPTFAFRSRPSSSTTSARNLPTRTSASTTTATGHPSDTNDANNDVTSDTNDVNNDAANSFHPICTVWQLGSQRMTNAFRTPMKSQKCGLVRRSAAARSVTFEEATHNPRSCHELMAQGHQPASARRSRRPRGKALSIHQTSKLQHVRPELSWRSYRKAAPRTYPWWAR